MLHSVRLLMFVVFVASVSGCAGPRPGTPHKRMGDEIVVAGQLFHTGAPVVLWLDHKGYDAYRGECRFAPERRLPSKAGKGATSSRYGSFRKHLSSEDAERVRADGWSLPMLREYVDLFVLHYDVCGTSRRCFKVLHDLRGLSVHFMLDVDGTIYQTLDVKERAWHAGPANDRSVGIEIANMGAYDTPEELAAWYVKDSNDRVVFQPPETNGALGVRTPGFVARPSRDDLVRGTIHDRALNQYDLTDEQYRSLIRLTATLCRVLPRIRCDVPRDAAGEVRTDAMSAEELGAFSGILGHYHLTPRKIDPGPALNWHRVLDGVRECR